MEMQTTPTTFQNLFINWYDTSIPTDRCSDTACKVALWIVSLITLLPALILGLWAAWDYCCNRGAPEPAPAPATILAPNQPQTTAPLPPMASPTPHRLGNSPPPRLIRMMERIVPSDVNAVVQELAQFDETTMTAILSVQEVMPLAMTACNANDNEKATKIIRASYLLMQLQALYFFRPATILTEIRELLVRHNVTPVDPIITMISNFFFRIPGSRGITSMSPNSYSAMMELLNSCPVDMRNALFRRTYTFDTIPPSEDAPIDILRSNNPPPLAHEADNLTTLITALLEGPFNSAPRRQLAFRQLHATRADSYGQGPFIIMGTPYRYDAFLVPQDTDKALILQFLNMALERGMITRDELRELSGKVYTTPEYIRDVLRR